MNENDKKKKGSAWYRAGSASIRQVSCVEHLLAEGWLNGTELDYEENQYIGSLSASKASKLIELGYKRRDLAKAKGLLNPDQKYPTRPIRTCTD